MKRLLKQLLSRSGWLVRRYAGLKFGVVFERDVSILLGNCPVRLVFDVGANRGVAAAEFLRIFPECNVYAFEPLDEAYDKLSIIARQEPRLHAYRVALGAECGEADLLVNDNSEMATLRSSQTRGVRERRSVRVETLDGFLRNNIALDGIPVDLLKIDTEGFEVEVLRGAIGALAEGRIRLVYTECSMRAGDHEHTLFFELSEFLSRTGYNFVASYDQCVWENSYSGYCNALFKWAS